MKLNQLLAIERGIKNRAQKLLTQLHRANKHPNLFNGQVRTYSPKDEDGETFPDEKNIVQLSVEDNLREAKDILSELFDITLQKDAANTEAMADVEVNGEKILTDVPATTLIFLEKQLNDLHTYIQELPVLDQAKEWKEKDEATGLYKTEPSQKHRTQKVQRPIVLYQATEKHPAQTQLITEDRTVGFWNTQELSSAIPVDRRKALTQRVETLQKAVKIAREQANSAPVKREKQMADKVFGYLFSD